LKKITGFNLFDEDDSKILEIIAHGEFNIIGNYNHLHKTLNGHVWEKEIKPYLLTV
jgi:hypothetical protein